MNVKILSLTFYLPLFFAFLFFSCSEPQEKSNQNFPQFSDTLNIDVGFPHQISSFDYEGKTYIYCYDLVTFKKVKLYDEDFNYIKTFSVDLFSNLGLYLSEIEMIRPDSVLLLTDNNTNTLISLNLTTGKNKKVALNDIVKLEEINVPIEFHSGKYGGFRSGQSIFLMMSPSISGVEVKFPREDPIEAFKVFDSISKVLPLFVRLEDVFDEPRVTFIEKSKGLKEALKGRCEYYQNNFYMAGQYLIHTSSGIPFFDVYDIKNKKAKSAKIYSSYTDVSSPFRTWKEIDEKPTVLYNDLPRRDMIDAGKVRKICSNPVKRRYNVFLYYSKDNRPKSESEIEPFIWQVYNKDFKLIDEREHKNFDSDCSELFCTKKYLFLPYYNEETYDPEKAVLLRYTF